MNSIAKTLLDLVRLSKPRVVLLFVVTTWAGAVLASGALWTTTALAALVGTALSVAGSGALNQYLERERDRVMERTRQRVLPEGRLAPTAALAFGLLTTAAGVALLTAAVRPLCGLLAAAGALYYVLLYTLVLKPRTRWSAVAGGPAGVFPPLIGWAATGEPFNALAVWLAALMFLWSPLHFWSLVIARHEEYDRAGIPTPATAAGGRHAALLAAAYAAAVGGVSLLPAVSGGLGGPYLLVAVAAGIGLGAQTLRMVLSADPARAWAVHKWSGAYLALVLAGMVGDRVL